jgi:hypothetical protein
MERHDLARQILSQTRRFGLTTPIAARRILASQEPRAVRDALNYLVNSGRIHRHRTGRLVYFTRTPEPLPAGPLRRAYMTLSHCTDPKPPRHLVSYRKLVIAGVPKIPAYISPQSKIVWIRTQPVAMPQQSWDLRQQLMALQETFREPRFLPLVDFARLGGFAVDYLMVADDQAEEFDRWLARHPLVSHLRTPAVRIPVRVCPMKLPAGCP